MQDAHRNIEEQSRAVLYHLKCRFNSMILCLECLPIVFTEKRVDGKAVGWSKNRGEYLSGTCLQPSAERRIVVISELKGRELQDF